MNMYIIEFGRRVPQNSGDNASQMILHDTRFRTHVIVPSPKLNNQSVFKERPFPHDYLPT